MNQTRPDTCTRLPQSRAGGQRPYLRSLDHLGRSGEVKKVKRIKKVKWGPTDGRTKRGVESRSTRLKRMRSHWWFSSGEILKSCPSLDIGFPAITQDRPYGAARLFSTLLPDADADSTMCSPVRFPHLKYLNSKGFERKKCTASNFFTERF